MPHPLSPAFRFARTCYRHPAGQVGVAITDWLVGLGWVLPAPRGYHISPSGLVSLYALGARGQGLRTHRLYTFCTDSTEKRHHVSGDLGAALTQWLFSRDWVSRPPEGGRTLLLTVAGRTSLTALGVRLPLQLPASPSR